MKEVPDIGKSMGQARPNVLVVETGHAARGSTVEILREAGIAVTVVRGGGAALAAIASTPFDLAIVTTTLLGAIDGVEIVKEARRRQPELEILFVGQGGAPGNIALGTLTTTTDRACDARRLLGRVRERLLCGRDPHADLDRYHRAEFGIAEAKLACLYHRRESAGAGSAGELARDLDRDIAETAAQCQNLLSGMAAYRQNGER